MSKETTRSRLDYLINFEQRYKKGKNLNEWTATIVKIENYFDDKGEFSYTRINTLFRSSKYGGKEKDETKKFESYNQAEKWAIGRLETIKEEEIQKEKDAAADLILQAKLAGIAGAQQSIVATTQTP